jgi:hypothetical protein
MMKKLIFWLLLLGGGYAVYRSAEGYAVVAYVGVLLAFGFLFKKLHTGDALRLIGFVIGFMAVMLGGGVIIARNWSEAAAGVWIGVCIILLMVFQGKIKRMIPTFRIANEFEELIKAKMLEEKQKQNRDK